MPRYAKIQIKMRRVVSNFCARRPNVRAAGKATTCVSNNASNKLVLSRPSAVPYAVARSMIVYTPSI